MVSALGGVKLSTFWNDFKAGKKPVMLLMTPPQHGKSLSVIDFIAWAVGHDPELRVIYSSFSIAWVFAPIATTAIARHSTYRFSSLVRGSTTSTSCHQAVLRVTTTKGHEVMLAGRG